MKKIQQVLLISFLFIVIFFDIANAQCTIAVNSTTSGSAGISATSLTISHTVSGSNTILIVRASTKDSDPTSVTYNSTSLTKLATQHNSAQYVSIWYLINPASGTHNVVVNGTAGFTPIIGVTSFTGVHQSSPFGTVVSGNFSGSAPSLTVSSATGEMVMDVLSVNFTPTVGSGQTQQYNVAEFVYFGAGSTKAGASSVTMTWSAFSPTGAQMAVPLKKCASALAVDAGTDKTTCNGTGVAIGGNPTATGGTSPYTYSWSPSTGLSSSTSANPTASPSSTTSYTVTVTDNVSATSTDVMVVTVNALPTADAGGNKDLCNGSSVAIGGSPTASGGSSPYTYIWSPSTGLSSTTTANPTANPTSTTSYSVTVTDNNGCSKMSTAVITVNALPTASAGSNKTTCNGTSVNIGGSPTASGGTSPYTYSWSPTTALSLATVANPDATPTSTISYSVTVTDNKGCIKVASMSVTVDPLPTADAGADKNICPGSSTTIGGSPTASGTTSPYTYSWSPTTALSSSTNANPTANPSSTTSYTVTVTDFKGCTKKDVVIVTVNSVPTANAGGNKNLCTGSSVVMGGSPTASGGTSPYTYSWTPSSWLSSTTIANPTASSIGTITYSVTVTDNNGCTNRDAATVTVNSLPTANAGTDKTICSGSSTSIGGSPTGSGGTSPYTYSWNPTTALSSSTNANPSANPTSATSYTVTVTDNNGCTNNDIVIVTVDPLPTVDAGADKTICTGSSTSIGGSPTASGGTSPYTYSWNPTTALSFSTIANPTANPTATTSYTVTVTDNKGCSYTDVVVVNVNSLPTVSAGSNQSICLGASASLGGSPTASGGVSPYTYSWSPSTALSSATAANPSANPTSTTNYTVTVTDNGGCVKSSSVSVTVNSVTVSVTPASANISGGDNISLTASGASTYSWSPSTGLNQTTGATVIATPSTTTSYTVTGTNGNGCSATQLVVVTVYATGSCSGCTIFVSTNNSSNYTVSSGQKLCITSTGTVTGTITLNGGTICNQGTFTPGTFNYTTGVFDNYGNATTGSISLTNSATLTNYSGGTLTISGTLSMNNSAASFINHGTATITGAQTKSGGTITNDGSLTFNSSTGQSGGTYTNSGTISCTDLTINGGTFDNNTPGSISVNGNFVNSGTASGNSGTITCTGNFSNSGTFNLNGGFISSVDFTNNGTIHGPGTGNGCATIKATGTTTNSGTIDAYADVCDATPPTGTIKIDINSGTVTNVSYCTCCLLNTPTITGTNTICSGTSTTLTASAGTSYSWSTGATTQAITVSPSTTTNYSITITYANGCVRTVNGVVTVNPSPTVTASSNITICNGSSTTLTASGALTYTWSPSTGLSASTGVTVTASPTTTTNYTVTGTNSNGCTGAASVTISISNSLIVDAGNDVTIAIGNSAIIGSSPTALGGVSPYTYLWSPGTGLNSTSIANPVAAPSVTTAYTVTVTDNAGCIASDEIIVSLNTISYATLRKKLDGGYYTLINNALFFKYENEYIDGTTNYKIYDLHKKEIPLSACGLTNQVMKYGDNRYALDFSSCGGFFVAGQYYTLELKSEKNEIYLLRFKY